MENNKIQEYLFCIWEQYQKESVNEFEQKNIQSHFGYVFDVDPNIDNGGTLRRKFELDIVFRNTDALCLKKENNQCLNKLRHCVLWRKKGESCCKKNLTWELLLQMGLTVWAREAKIIHGSNNLFCGTEGHPPPRPGKRNSTMLFINMHSKQALQEYFFL